jgi:TolB-like protein/Tfp pilus assembly protein PilF
MKDSMLVSSPEPSGQPAEARLDSWKEIATYLKRDISTVQRWEAREGMPIHRHVHAKRGSVYAFTFELDAWLQSRNLRLDSERYEAEESAPAATHHKSSEIFRIKRWLILGGVVALCLFAVTYIRIGRGPESTARPKINSLAVLPLKNLSGDKEQDYLADGMTEELIGRLAGIHDLHVISRTSVMRFKDTQLSVSEISKTLAVDAIVEGSVIREGTRIRVHAQLIRAATDEHLWSATYDRELQDALALESDVAQSIARKVEVTLSGKEREKLAAAGPISPKVYESYLKGQFVYSSSPTSRDSIEESIGYFKEAINIDPTFAPAYVGLAGGYTDLGTVFLGADPPGDARSKAMSAVRRALELDPDVAGAHALLAYLLQTQWHWAEAEAEYRGALELNPNDAEARDGLASWLLCHGRLDEALTAERRARELDPLAISGTNIGWILFNAHRYDDAIQEFRSALAVRPDSTDDLWRLGFALMFNRQPQEAVSVVEKSVSLSGRSPGAVAVLVSAYANAGRRSDALRLLEELQTRNQIGYVPPGAFVIAYLGLDDREQVFAWLEQAYKEQSNILQYLKVHPIFDPVRNDPRFPDLVRRVGLSKV